MADNSDTSSTADMLRVSFVRARSRDLVPGDFSQTLTAQHDRFIMSTLYDKVFPIAQSTTTSDPIGSHLVIDVKWPIYKDFTFQTTASTIGNRPWYLFFWCNGDTEANNILV